MRAIVFVALALLCASASAYTYSVAAGAVECFMEEVTAGEKVMGGFNVLAGGMLDIDVKVLDPSNKAVFQEDKESSGTFSFVSSMTGLYSICLSNSMSTVTAKVVNFHFHVGNALTSHQVAKKEHLTGLEIGVMSLSEGLSFLKDELDYVKTRERMHRDTNESTNSRVMWWSFVETAALLSISVWQIMSLKKFFETRRAI